jgi:hypothetical protein
MYMRPAGISATYWGFGASALRTRFLFLSYIRIAALIRPYLDCFYYGYMYVPVNVDCFGGTIDKMGHIYMSYGG